jgi:hypothetical protein
MSLVISLVMCMIVVSGLIVALWPRPERTSRQYRFRV